jgi:hypothetical protein
MIAEYGAGLVLISFNVIETGGHAAVRQLANPAHVPSAAACRANSDESGFDLFALT